MTVILRIFNFDSKMVSYKRCECLDDALIWITENSNLLEEHNSISISFKRS